MFFYLGATLATTFFGNIEMTFGSGQALHYIFAARGFVFKLEIFRWQQRMPLRSFAREIVFK